MWYSWDRLRFNRSSLKADVIREASWNGSSELLSNVSIAVVGILDNFQLMRYAGEQGVAAYGIIQCVTAIFNAVFIGYSMGVTPVIGYHYGAADKPGLKNLLKRSLIIIGSFSLLILVISYAFAPAFAYVFVGYDRNLMELSVRGLRLFSFAFLMMGFNVFGSAFFTAVSNGLVSAIISAASTVVFQCVCVLLLPHVLGLDGIWISILAAEILSLFVVVFFFKTCWKAYFN